MFLYNEKAQADAKSELSARESVQPCMIHQRVFYYKSSLLPISLLCFAHLKMKLTSFFIMHHPHLLFYVSPKSLGDT